MKGFIDKHFKIFMAGVIFLLGVTIAWSWIQYKDRETAELKLKAQESVMKSAPSLDR